MTPKEKAEELVSKYKPYVYPFIGSSFMTGDEYPEQILNQAKICALTAVDEILSLNAESFDELPNPHHYFSINYWQEVKQEIEKL